MRDDATLTELGDMARAAAQEAPAVTALISSSGEELTYAELESWVDRVSAQLIEHGVRSEDPVGVYVRRGRAELVVSLLSILRIGAVYLPFDVQHPPTHLENIAKATRVQTVLTTSDLLATLTSIAACRPLVVCERHSDRPPCTARNVVSDEQLAYLVFTSGSTGVAKGVAMTRRGLSRLAHWQRRALARTERVLQYAPVSFDVSLQEIVSSIGLRGTLCLVDEPTRRNPARLLDFIVEREIETLFAPFVALQQLSDYCVRSGKFPLSLKQIFTAGERLRITDAIREMCLTTDATLTNDYGPTEAHLVTSLKLGTSPESWTTFPPIGAPVFGVRVFVVDSERAPVAPGEVGQLFVGGPAVARCYWDDPTLTADRFLPDWLSGEKGARLYRTGDLVRELPDGSLAFEGRVDDQVKIRGFRVEPAEVEALLAAHQAVRDVAVVPWEVKPGVSRLAAFIVAEPQTATDQIRTWLRSRVADHLVPTRFELVGSLPRTASGKVDRGQLRESSSVFPSPPRSQRTDHALRHIEDIWRDILGHSDFGTDDDFFDVGGDSLLATMAAEKLRNALGVDIELSAFLEDATVRGVANRIRQLRSGSGKKARSPAQLVPIRAGDGSNVHVVLVHPLGGTLLAYRDLVRALPARVPLWGMEWSAGDEHIETRPTIESTASQHVNRVEAGGSNVEVTLLGWSFGGVLAYEIAQQLLRRGRRVRLGLIDANPAFDTTTGKSSTDLSAASRFSRELSKARDAADRLQRDVAFHRLFQHHGGTLFGSSAPTGLGLRHVERYLELAERNLYAAARYSPISYPGSVDLFQPKQSREGVQQASVRILEKLVNGALRCHSIPGDHHSLLRQPNVEELVAALFTAKQRRPQNENR